MAINFGQFDNTTNPAGTDNLIGFRSTALNGEKSWTVQKLLDYMKTQLLNVPYAKFAYRFSSIDYATSNTDKIAGNLIFPITTNTGITLGTKYSQIIGTAAPWSGGATLLNNITGASFTGGVITLPAGTYDISLYRTSLYSNYPTEDIAIDLVLYTTGGTEILNSSTASDSGAGVDNTSSATATVRTVAGSSTSYNVRLDAIWGQKQTTDNHGIRAVATSTSTDIVSVEIFKVG
tara:strand:+ start:1012 stop:1713 length:702 start_codon:yes stop_codon:yes gene_type:complete